MSWAYISLGCFESFVAFVGVYESIIVLFVAVLHIIALLFDMSGDLRLDQEQLCNVNKKQQVKIPAEQKNYGRRVSKGCQKLKCLGRSRYS